MRLIWNRRCLKNRASSGGDKIVGVEKIIVDNFEGEVALPKCDRRIGGFDGRHSGDFAVFCNDNLAFVKSNNADGIA